MVHDPSDSLTGPPHAIGETPRAIAYWVFPPGEREAVRSILNNLRNMAGYVREVQADLALLEYAHTPPIRTGTAKYYWMFIAARDSIMMIYHFASLLEAFDGLLKRAKQLARMTDKAALREAKAELKRCFPDYHAARQGVAHLGDHSKTPERLDAHGVRYTQPDGSPGQIAAYNRGMMMGRAMGATVEGKWVSQELSQQTVDDLKNILRLTQEAFAPAAAESFKISGQRSAKSWWQSFGG